jgi:hypothetical protein
MQCVEAVMRERGRFGPSALACVQAALSHLPAANCLTAAPLSAAPSTSHERLDMVDAESFLLSFYKECFAMLRVLRNLQRLALRTSPSSNEDSRDTGFARRAPSTRDGHSSTMERLYGDSSKDHLHRSRARNWNVPSESILTAILRANIGRQAVIHTASAGNLEVEVSHFFHTLMHSDPLRASTVSVPNFRRAALCMLLEPCRMLPMCTSSSDNTFLFVEAVKRSFTCGGRGDMINYVRMWATTLSYLEETQSASLGPHEGSTIKAVERGVTIVSSTNA